MFAKKKPNKSKGKEKKTTPQKRAVPSANTQKPTAPAATPKKVEQPTAATTQTPPSQPEKENVVAKPEQQQKTSQDSFTYQSPFQLFVFIMFSFGLYGFYWLYRTAGELSKKSDLAPNQKLIFLLFIPGVNSFVALYFLWRLSKALNGVFGVSHMRYFLFFLFLGPLGMALVQNEINKKAQPHKTTKKETAKDAADEKHASPKKPAKKKLTPKEKLQQRNVYLARTGLRLDARSLDRVLFRIALGITLLIVLGVIIFSLRAGVNFAGVFIYILIGCIVGLPLSLLASHMLFYFVMDYRIYMRSREMEKVLPDYLQLCALNIKAGMSVDKALWFSVRPKFGVLATEMEVVAKRTLTGTDLSKALSDLTLRFDSATLNRAMALLRAGISAGGEIGDLLNKISADIQETEILKKEMSASVTTYVIFIGFATVGAAPFLMALSYHLLAVVQGLAAKLTVNTSSQSSMFSVSPNSINLGDYQIFAIVALALTSLFSAMIISIIQKGNVKEGLRSIPLFIGTSIALFFVGKFVIGLMFGGII